MVAAITAIGTANPKYKRHQQETVELICAGIQLKKAEKRLLKSLYKSTGIDYRHSVLSDYCSEPGEFTFFPNNPAAPFPKTSERMKIYKDNALPLALTAIDNCLASLTDFDKETITHLITVSCTGMYAPGVDIEIVQTLNLNSNTQRTAINFMGCYGAFNGLKVADAICRANTTAKVLIVCIELCTIHFQNSTSMDSLISNAIFADGAAAVLVEADYEDKNSFCLQAFHCDLLPQTSKDMAWHIADSGFDIVLSSYIPDVIEKGIAAFTQRLLAQNKFTPADIDIYAIHPGGIKILQACEKALKIRYKKNKYAYQVLKNYGNMSSATVLFVLKAILDDIDKHDHQKTVFSCAFGPGLTLESMLLSLHCPQ
jgi:alpha-pyrone synthase